MAILNIVLSQVGVVGVSPSIAYIATNDTLATVTTAGYLNQAVQQGNAFDDKMMCLVTTKTSPTATVTSVGWLEVSHVGSNWSLIPTGSPGSVVLPTVANQLVHATNTTGTLSTDAANVVNLGNITAGSSAVAGSLTSFAGTGSAEFLRLAAINNTGGNFSTTISNTASVGQSQTISIPDAGAATANFLISTTAGGQSIAGGLTVSSGNLAVTLGNITAAAGNIAATLGSLAAGTTVTGGTGVTATTGNVTATAGNVVAGSSGVAGTLISFPATAGNGTLILSALNAGGAFNTTIRNSVMGQSSVVSIPDPGAATANFLLDTGAANILAQQQFVGLSNVLTFGTGTWTITRIAQGNYVSRHTPGDETSIIGIDVTPMIRVAASKGFRLDSFDVIYAIAANPLDAHSVTLDRIEYANNVAVSVNSVAITATLATATQANPYVTNAVVDVPAFDVTADSKYVIEVTVDNAAASEYDFYGIMLRFSQTIG